MMVENELRTYDSHRDGAGMESYAVDHSAALLLFPQPCQVDVGSSTCIRIDERYFLATAGHNIEDLEDDSQIKVIVPGTDHAPVPSIGRNSRRFHGAATVDVAWIELQPEAARQSRLRFLCLSQLSRHDREAHFYVQGYPSEMVAVGEDTTADLDPLSMGFLTRPIDPSVRGERHQPGVDLAVEYAVHGEAPTIAALPRAPGMSGGGMWQVAGEGGRLVAITRTWYSGRRELCGTAIHHWLQLVYVDLPALRSRLEPLLH